MDQGTTIRFWLLPRRTENGQRRAARVARTPAAVMFC